MAFLCETVKTSLSQLLADAPALVLFHTYHPDIPVLTPSSPDYHTHHQEYNAYNAILPLAIIFPSNADQLIAAVKYCTSQRAPVAITVRGGGHDAYGRNALAGAVQIDFHLMKEITIQASDLKSSEDCIAAVDPGVTAIELHRALDAAGRAAPTGWVGTVGVTGWACGGGYGLEAGTWGLGVDGIVGARLVTPNGELVDTDDDPELLWAVRGAGLGNFGVIFELRLRTYRKPRYLAGMLAFPLHEGEKVLSGLQELSDKGQVPANFSNELMVNTTELRPAIMFLFAWVCDGEDVTSGWAFLARLKSLGTVVLDTIAETSILQFHELLHQNPAVTARGYYTMHSLALPRLTPELIKLVMDRPPPPGGTSAILFHYARGRTLQPNLAAAWANRDEHYIWTPCGFAELDANVEQKDAAKRWSEELYQAAVDAGLGLEKGYWSLSRPEHCDAVRFFGEDTVARLRKLKKKYNPQNALPAALPVLV
ncbi:FAD binding domain protein [Diplogelasinospora grovesii]|uniref:FAD binding domain protein n=1 Tax=Diplogelasinospora grovesii TaxID=303347 RepID=A0AAN6S2U2_9PEZI|nr:FAD binding domain protein [Diplogelasinospora grovesii]